MNIFKQAFVRPSMPGCQSKKRKFTVSTVMIMALFFSLISSIAFSQDRHFTGLGDGISWSNPLNWEPNDVPDIASENAVIDQDGTFVVEIDANYQIGSLTIGEDDEAFLANGSTLFVANAFTENKFTLSGAELSTAVIISDGTILSGHGTWQMSDSLNNLISGPGSGNNSNILTNGANHTIAGAGNLGNNNMGLINHGLIDANRSNVLNLFPSNVDLGDGANVVNNNLLQASGGGTLELSGGLFDNRNGMILALSGSKVSLKFSAEIQGGILDTADDGRIVIENGAQAILGGVITNNAVVEQLADSDQTFVTIRDGTILSGDGSWQMSDSLNNLISGPGNGSNSNILTNGANHTIAGAGNLGNNTMGLINHGLIDANRSNAMNLFPSSVDVGGGANVVNEMNGVLRASGPGGMVLFDGVVVNQSGGEVNVDSFLTVSTSASLENRTNGIVSGDGVVTFEQEGGGLTSDGSVTPGLEPGLPGQLSIIGNYIQTGLGNFEIEIQSSNEFDSLQVSQIATLAGELDIVLLEGFAPAQPTDEYVIIQAGQVVGRFSNTPNDQVVFDGGQFDVIYNADSVVLTNFNSLPPNCFFISSSDDAGSSPPIVGTIQDQIAIVNAGPSGVSLGPVKRHSDLHLQSSFDCSDGDGGHIAFFDAILPGFVGDVVSLQDNALPDPDHIRLFREKTRILTNSELAVDIVPDADEDTTYGGMHMLPKGGTIAAGTWVTSHILHFDTPTGISAELEGSVIFESDIIGVIFDGNLLNQSDVQLGDDGTIYPSLPARAWEIAGEIGFITISEDHRTITARARVQDVLDQLRVVTAAAPSEEVICAEPYVSPDTFIVGADEVTLNNCDSAWYHFSFELPDNFENAALSGIANVDDVAVLYLNGNQISASVEASDLGMDRVDNEGRPLLSWPTTDSFVASNQGHFVAGNNELVFGVVGDLSQFDPTGVEFEALVCFDSAILLGDVNQDGVFDLLDIAPFIELIVIGDFLSEADINLDSEVNLLDVDPFVELLAN